MKKLLLVAAITAILSSCSYESKVAPLEGSNGLSTFSAQTADKTEVYGVKDASGKEIIPAEYRSIRWEDNLIFADKEALDLALFRPDGTRISPDSISWISSYDNYVYLSGNDKTYYYFKKSQKLTGPYIAANEHDNLFICIDDQVNVLDAEGNLVLKGDQITNLYSRADSAGYYLVTVGKEIKLFDSTFKPIEKIGKRKVVVDAKKLEKLPKANWSYGRDSKMYLKISTINKLEVFLK